MVADDSVLVDRLAIGIDANPANAYTKDTFNVLPTRNYFLTVSAEF